MVARKRSKGGAYRRKNQIKPSPEVQARRDESAIKAIGNIRLSVDAFFADRGLQRPKVSEIIQGAGGILSASEGQQAKRWVSRKVVN